MRHIYEIYSVVLGKLRLSKPQRPIVQISFYTVISKSGNFHFLRWSVYATPVLLVKMELPSSHP
jgi:hypothetical protein